MNRVAAPRRNYQHCPRCETLIKQHHVCHVCIREEKLLAKIERIEREGADELAAEQQQDK